MKAENGIGCLIWLVFGVLSACIAGSKGRSAVGWFFLGLLIPLPALIIICCLSNLKEEAARFEHINSSNRRLKEQLKQERMKNEHFRREAGRRLDFHDQQLGTDSRGLGGPTESPPPLLESESDSDAEPAETETADRLWQYAKGGKTLGPIRESELAKALRLKHLDATILVWTVGMSEWKPAGEVGALKRYFEGQERG
jgi:hypothetical protein